MGGKASKSVGGCFEPSREAWDRVCFNRNVWFGDNVVVALNVLPKSYISFSPENEEP